ncbi:hypothetical protein K439DRAFT_1621151 [Ramaria rubella]|nr:hypothetical protein K439DRAFT_1621151 [Ramaria rubella]
MPPRDRSGVLTPTSQPWPCPPPPLHCASSSGTKSSCTPTALRHHPPGGPCYDHGWPNAWGGRPVRTIASSVLQPLHQTCHAWDQLICMLLFCSIVVAGAELEGVRGAELLEALTTHAALVRTLAILTPNDYLHGSEQLEYGCLWSLVFWAGCTRIQTFHLNSVPLPHEALSTLLGQTSLHSVSVYYIDLISLRLPPHNDLFSRLKALKIVDCVHVPATLAGARGLRALKLWERTGMGTLDALCRFPLQAPLLSSLTLVVGDGGAWLDYLARHFESSSARHMHTLSLEGEGTPPGWSFPVIPAPMVHVLHALVSHLVHLMVLLVKDHTGLTVTALDGLIRVAPALEHLGIARIGGEALPWASLNATSMIPHADLCAPRRGPQLHWLSPMRSLLLLRTLEWNYGTHRLYCYQCQGRMLSSTMSILRRELPGLEWIFFLDPGGGGHGQGDGLDLRGQAISRAHSCHVYYQTIPQADIAAGWSGLRACAACGLTIVMPGEGFTGAGGVSPIVAYGMGVAEKHSAWSVARGLPSLTFRRPFRMTQVARKPDHR